MPGDASCPGVSASMRNIVAPPRSPGLPDVRAMQIVNAAPSAPVMNHLRPLTSHPPVVGVADGRQRGRVGAGARGGLGHREARPDRALGERPEVALLLLGGRDGLEQVHVALVGRGDVEGERAEQRPARLLEHHARGRACRAPARRTPGRRAARRRRPRGRPAGAGVRSSSPPAPTTPAQRSSSGATTARTNAAVRAASSATCGSGVRSIVISGLSSAVEGLGEGQGAVGDADRLPPARGHAARRRSRPAGAGRRAAA